MIIIDNKGPSENNTSNKVKENDNCRIWKDNNTIFKGVIGLLYSSDYGYSSNSIYWKTSLRYGYYNGDAIKHSNWLYMSAHHGSNEWFLSPTTSNKVTVANWSIGGHVTASTINEENYANDVRPVLYLKSNVKIISGDGSINNPYELTI